MSISRRQVVFSALAVVLPMYSRKTVLAAEPITTGAAAAFVGLALLQGGISYVGGKVMSSALGDPTISDVRIWIQNAVAELEAYVSAELKIRLDALVMEQMRASLQGVTTILYEYASLKPKKQEQNKLLLQNSDIEISRLIPLSLNYDQALFITTTAMAYKLFSIYALYKLDKDPGHIKSARPMMDDFVKQASASRDRVGLSMSPKSHFSINCTIVGETKYTCIATQDGNAIVPSHTAPAQICRNGICRDSFDVMRESITKEIAQRTEPMQRQTDEFLKLANSSIRLAVDCYDKMCRQVGDKYSPPNSALPLLKIEQAIIPDILVMPGAVVLRPEP
ncbi:hypothetical protein [Cupriavidus sp. D39]|uniref:hypothetical protein n=1 Tax=Cupriavidus sp. D39 TaxID=2997877 RepID=UPI00226FD9F4|nr:hypothetical protein [Cupriavidus sp. D39]MCY0854040.1 hypothetical protein [Cupriavidus sp. D39]